MRPSKLRLPDSTETTARSSSLTAVGDLLRQRPGVADAGRAAVADEVEAELLERLGQPGAVEVFGDDLRAGRERGLDPRLALQPARDARCARGCPAPIITDGFDVFVQLVIAAITTCAVVELEASRRRRVTRPRRAVVRQRRRAAPRAAAAGRRRRGDVAGLVGGRVRGGVGLGDGLVLRVGLVAVAGHVVAQRLAEDVCDVAQRDAVLRALRARRGSARRSRGRARSSSEKVGCSECSSCHRPCSLA